MRLLEWSILKLSFRPWKQATFHQAVGALAFGVLLVMSSSLVYLQSALGPLIKELESRSEVIGFVQSDLPENKENELKDQIRTTVGNAPNIRWVSRKELVDQIEKVSPALVNQIYSLGKEYDAIVPKLVAIQGDVSAEQLDRLRSLRGIDSAESSKYKWQPVVTAISSFRWGAGFLGYAVALIAMYGLMLVLRIHVQGFRDSLQHLRILGATRLQTALPGLGLGLTLGFVGGTLAGIFWIGLSLNVPQWIQSLSPLFQSLETPSLMWALALPILGMFLGVLGAGLAHLRLELRARA